MHHPPFQGFIPPPFNISASTRNGVFTGNNGFITHHRFADEKLQEIVWTPANANPNMRCWAQYDPDKEGYVYTSMLGWNGQPVSDGQARTLEECIIQAHTDLGVILNETKGTNNG